jgi:predicted GNAT family acetyltransferase
MEITVVDNPELNRFEALLATGEVAGFALYKRTDKLITFTHAEVFDQYEGEGVGTTLAKASLDQARNAGIAVQPRCPFYKAFIERHPEYADLVPR